MAIICDVCKKDCTPKNDNIDEYEIMEINGKICLCIDCKIALGNYVRGKEFKQYVKNNEYTEGE